MKIKAFYFLFIAVLLVSCGEGYIEEDGQWAWVNYSTDGKHILEMDTDSVNFKVLDNKKYSKNTTTVFWKGIEIENADAKTFKVISKKGYSKDTNHVFLDNEIILFADPNSFEVIGWPYSKDDTKIFNGNLPMAVQNIDEFKVSNSNGSKSSSTKSLFIKKNSDYMWLDTLDIKEIIVSKDAEAVSGSETFIGFRKVK